MAGATSLNFMSFKEATILRSQEGTVAQGFKNKYILLYMHIPEPAVICTFIGLDHYSVFSIRVVLVLTKTITANLCLVYPFNFCARLEHLIKWEKIRLSNLSS